MRHIAAYLLLVLGGNKTPSADDIKKVLSAAGIDGDDARITQLIAELKGKDPYELMSAGKEKLASVGGVGGGSAAASSGGDAGAAAAAAEPEPEPEEESSSEEMELDLFG